MLKMLTGFAAKVFRLGETEWRGELPDAGLRGGVAKAIASVEMPSDAEMLDWMDRQSSWSGSVAFRWSTTGRGWRLMEVPPDYPGLLREVAPPSASVRQAIADAALTVAPTDTQTLDWLDQQTGSYTGRILWRLSEFGRGWRLHETSRDGATATVREAISAAMRKDAAVTACCSAFSERPGKPKDIPKPSSMYRITQTEPDVFKCDVMAQDGFETWTETSLDAAVRSVIQGADTINHASISRDNITVRLTDPFRAYCLARPWGATYPSARSSR